jgi:cytochrome P450
MKTGKRHDSPPAGAPKPVVPSGVSGCPFHVRVRNMRDTVVRAIVRFPIVPMTYGRCRQAFSSHPLPPGELVNLDACERANQRFLLERFQELGPIFKAVGGRRLQVCIVGIPRCREFLKAHGESLTQVTVKLESLFPGGFLRKMRGDQHRKYRQALLRAIDPELVSTSRVTLERIIEDGLGRYAGGRGETADSARDYKRTMSAIMTGLLVHLFFGAPFGSPAFEELMEAYRRLGPEEFEWWIGPEQKRQYMEIRGLVLRQLSRTGSASEGWLENCILRRMDRDGALDETSLGHLIYMVEMGRFDMYSLFRWLSKFASANPQFLPRIADEAKQTPDGERGGQRGIAEAFVLETLRLVQSERLMRVANRDLIFEGYLIPRFSSVRLCLWESHKAAETFAEPFAFNPDRFLDGVVTGDQYAPFGLDQHICPVADINIQLSALFVRILAAQYSPVSRADGEAVRGRYHWEPAEGLNVNLRPRLAGG